LVRRRRTRPLRRGRRGTSDAAATVAVRVLIGATSIASIGTAAPTAKVAADARAACRGRAASSSVRPSSSRACAAKAPFVINWRATVRASSGSNPRRT
jgi:hypothetical protein